MVRTIETNLAEVKVRVEALEKALKEKDDNNAVWHRRMEVDIRDTETKLETSMKELRREVDNVRDRVIENEQILLRVDHLATCMENTNSSVEKLSCKVDDMAEQKAKEYDKIRLSIITGTITLILGAILGKVISGL